MKNIFNTIRQKVNGMYPYIVRIDGQIFYLFEASQRTSLRMLIKIQKAFKNENLIFATVDPLFPDYSFIKYAAGTYIDYINIPIYFYKGGMFFEIEEKPINEGCIDLVLTKRIAPIQTVKLRTE